MIIIRRIKSRVVHIIRKLIRLHKIKKLGLLYVKPNFIYMPTINNSSVIVDAGCSYEADFSIHMIQKYGVTSYGVDPTKKHRSSLKNIEKKFKNKFIHLPYAMCVTDGVLIFHESKSNESGSILKDHINVRQDEIITYEVECISLKSLIKIIGKESIDLIKLDLEGAEYELFKSINRDELNSFKQIFIEFHHHAISNYTEIDTKRIVENICNFGFKCFSLDDHNYIFYKIGDASL